MVLASQQDCIQHFDPAEEGGLNLAVHNFTPTNEEIVRKEVLWNNENITDGAGTLLLWRHWERAEITAIQDICHHAEGRLLSHIEIQQRYGIPCTFLETLGLRMGIPGHWRSMLSADFQGNPSPVPEVAFPSGTILSITKAPARRLYAEIIQIGRSRPPAQRKWDLSVNIHDPDEWKQHYARPFRTTRETKMQSLQFRILHRIITCNHLLYRWGMKEEGSCTYCDQEDTLEHFFYACHSSRTFSSRVKEWLLAKINLSLSDITLKEFLLGVPRDSPQAAVINLILLWVRFFIHRQKLFGQEVLNLEH